MIDTPGIGDNDALLKDHILDSSVIFCVDNRIACEYSIQSDAFRLFVLFPVIAARHEFKQLTKLGACQKSGQIFVGLHSRGGEDEKELEKGVFQDLGAEAPPPQESADVLFHKIICSFIGEVEIAVNPFLDREAYFLDMAHDSITRKRTELMMNYAKVEEMWEEIRSKCYESILEDISLDLSCLLAKARISQSPPPGKGFTETFRRIRDLPSIEENLATGWESPLDKNNQKYLDGIVEHCIDVCIGMDSSVTPEQTESGLNRMFFFIKRTIESKVIPHHQKRIAEVLSRLSHEITVAYGTIPNRWSDILKRIGESQWKRMVDFDSNFENYQVRERESRYFPSLTLFTPRNYRYQT